MAQYIIEAITILTAVIICTILAVYILILKKNGWLGGNSKFYSCPNRECKRIFQKPAEVKDLSETPPRVYPACPHCGANLETVLVSKGEKKPKLEVKTSLQPKATRMKTGYSDSVLKDHTNTHNDLGKEGYLFVDQSSKGSAKIEARKPEIAEKVESPWKKSSKSTSEKAVTLGQVHSSQTKNVELAPTRQRTVIPKTVSSSLSGCQYGYGYLSQREKGEGIPDACIECPKSLDCMLPKYLKKEESVKEIKKWYIP